MVALRIAEPKAYESRSDRFFAHLRRASLDGGIGEPLARVQRQRSGGFPDQTAVGFLRGATSHPSRLCRGDRDRPAPDWGAGRNH